MFAWDCCCLLQPERDLSKWCQICRHDPRSSSSERGDLQEQPALVWSCKGQQFSDYLVILVLGHMRTVSSVLLDLLLICELRVLCDLNDDRISLLYLTEVPGITLLTPCIWTHSHKDNKQPRQSFNHRYSRSQKHSPGHTVLNAL